MCGLHIAQHGVFSWFGLAASCSCHTPCISLFEQEAMISVLVAAEEFVEYMLMKSWTFWHPVPILRKWPADVELFTVMQAGGLVILPIPMTMLECCTAVAVRFGLLQYTNFKPCTGHQECRCCTVEASFGTVGRLRVPKKCSVVILKLNAGQAAGVG